MLSWSMNEKILEDSEFAELIPCFVDTDSERKCCIFSRSHFEAFESGSNFFKLVRRVESRENSPESVF